MIAKGASPSLDVPCPRCGAAAGFRCLDLRERRGVAPFRIYGRVHVERHGLKLGRTTRTRPWKPASE